MPIRAGSDGSCRLQLPQLRHGGDPGGERAAERVVVQFAAAGRARLNIQMSRSAAGASGRLVAAAGDTQHAMLWRMLEEVKFEVAGCCSWAERSSNDVLGL
jgi:hypothetical protein